MKRFYILILGLGTLSISACGQEKNTKDHMNKNFQVKKTEEEWKHCLSPEQYRILRQKGTERAFTGRFYKHNEKGIYVCAGCGNELFKSETKFDSGTGWPSYYDAIPGAVVFEKDYSYGMIRTEVLCAKCGGHLGHVFDDGPQPTGLRYCINSASLDFKKK